MTDNNLDRIVKVERMMNDENLRSRLIKVFPYQLSVLIFNLLQNNIPSKYIVEYDKKTQMSMISITATPQDTQ